MPVEEVIKIFISHSSRDVKLAVGLIELIRSALRLPSRAIRCTSVVGYGLPAGLNFEELIREEISSSMVLIGIVSRASIASLYVSFELGARWGANKPLIPLLAPNLDPDILSGPLSTIHALKCDNREHLIELVNNLATQLKIDAEGPEIYQGQIDALIKLTNDYSKPDGPILLAKFILDKESKPATIQDGRYRHYKINLLINNVPRDIHSATYLLDESYKERVIEVNRAIMGFNVDITSYGDYTIATILKSIEYNMVVESRLSEALRKNYKTEMSRAIRDAIEDIEENS